MYSLVQPLCTVVYIQCNPAPRGSPFELTLGLCPSPSTPILSEFQHVVGRFTDVFVHSDQYSLVAAMAVDGYIAVDVIKGSFNHDLFSQFVIEQVVCFVFLHGHFLIFLHSFLQ